MSGLLLSEAIVVSRRAAHHKLSRGNPDVLHPIFRVFSYRTERVYFWGKLGTNAEDIE